MSEVERLLAAAKAGSEEDLGRLLESVRDYLLIVADRELGDGVRQKVAASDIVQETFLQAQQGFDRFRGRNEGEFRAWLNRILLNNVTVAARQYRAEKRDIQRELPLAWEGLDLDHAPCDRGPRPSSIFGRQEEQALSAAALAALPEEYRQVIALRNDERLTFAAVGARMDRSADAARKLWARAMRRFEEGLAARRKD